MRTTKIVLLCSVCLVLGWFVGQRDSSVVFADPAPKPQQSKAAQPLPQTGRLGASLWMNSGEYRACCVQTYRLAAKRLEDILRTKPVKPAIVMDLDETVFDNSSFQTYAFKIGDQGFDFSKEWAKYEKEYWKDVDLVPGARDFILGAVRQGVRMIFISNRKLPFAESTVNALRNLKLGPALDAGAELYLQPEKEPSSTADTADKSSRREAATLKYNVVMLFGDNLRDFSEAFKAQRPASGAPEDYRKAIERRNVAATEVAAGHWGLDWFVLPNAVYGEWEALISPDPKDVLHPSSMSKR
jgi:5'-nucleotidase (lipoprotein e(P4) family)